jgi:hypothetical protein
VGEGEKVAEEATTLYRAVKPEELVDIQEREALMNRGSAGGKVWNPMFT